MQILVESRDASAMPLHETAVSRLRFALRRLKNQVPRAKVMFSDANGPRGGIDKCCQVEIQTANAGTVVIVSRAGDWRTALERSLGRATRALTRTLQRRQKPDRGRAEGRWLGGAHA